MCQLKLLPDVREGGPDRVGEDKLIENRFKGSDACFVSPSFYFLSLISLTHKTFFFPLNHLRALKSTLASLQFRQIIHVIDVAFGDQTLVIIWKSNE